MTLISPTHAISAAASRHQDLLQAAADDRDVDAALAEIEYGLVALLDRVAACRAAREQQYVTAPAPDEFTRLMTATDRCAKSKEAKRFLLTMEDVNGRCDAVLRKLEAADSYDAWAFMEGDENPISDVYKALLDIGKVEHGSAMDGVFEFVKAKATRTVEVANAILDDCYKAAA